MSLYARLADHNKGHIDWEAHSPLLFTRIMRNFNFPVMYKKTNVGNRAQMIDVGASVKWMVASITSSSSTLDRLERMMDALESYFHPANIGGHCKKLTMFLSKLTGAVTRRLHKYEEHGEMCFISILNVTSFSGKGTLVRAGDTTPRTGTS